MRHVQVLLYVRRKPFLSNLRKSYSEIKGIQDQKTCFESLLARRLFRINFENKFSIQKLFLKVWGIFWYKLEHRMTLTSDFASEESHFCLIFKMRMADGAMSKISY